MQQMPSTATTPMPGMQELAEAFDRIGLEDTTRNAALMRRMDVKYVITEEQLKSVLLECTRDYRVLEIDDRRVARYETQYFDTPEMRFYHEHHSDRPRRRKVRVRRYADSGDAFLEVKQRQADGRTVKTRIPITVTDGFDISGMLSHPAFEAFGPLDAGRLQPSVSACFRRITLVDPDKEERVTIDFDVTFSHGVLERRMTGLVVAEVKQPRTGSSRFREVMRQHGIRPGSLSKYCLGVACLRADVKKNLFKSRIRRILQLTEHETAADIR
jgi:hypothetical protein